MVSGTWKKWKDAQIKLRNKPERICKMKESNMEVTSLFIGRLELLPNHAGMFQMCTENLIASFLYANIKHCFSQDNLSSSGLQY